MTNTRYPASCKITLTQTLTQMGESGAPMNWVIARGIAEGILRDAGLEHLIGTGPGQISLSKGWVYDQMREQNLSDRVGGRTPKNFQLIGRICCDISK